MKAKVHFNADSTLAVMPALIQKKFGIRKTRTIGGMLGSCMVAQVAFTLEAISGAPAKAISNHILARAGSHQGLNGFTLEQVLEPLNEPVKIAPGMFLKFDTEVFVYHSVEAVADAILEGYPVILAVPRVSVDRLETEASIYGDGATYATPIRPAPSDDPQFHSYLAIGLDVFGGENQCSPFIIVRDTRHEYCLNGYLKIGLQVLNDSFDNIRAFSVCLKREPYLVRT